MPNFNNPSNTSTFTETRDTIITRALRICSAIADEEVPTGTMIANGSEALNVLVKQWDTIGIHVWTETEGVLFLQPNQYQYQLDFNNSPDHFAQNWILASLSGAVSAGETQPTVNFNSLFGLTGITVNDNIGIVLDSGSVFWTTVQVVSPLTLTDPMADGAAANNPVFIYSEPIPEPLRIPSARRFILSNQIDTPLLRFARLDYREQPNKSTPGTITSYFYDPQLLVGYFYVWPSPSDASAIVRFTWNRRLNDFNVGTNTPDLPQEWANCLTWNLAKEIAPEYDVPLQKYQGIIMVRAAETLDACTGFDKEPESTFFGVSFTPSSR